MGQMFVIGEDALTCALGERLVVEGMGWTLPQPAVNTKGVTNLVKALARYAGLARLHPVLCIADTDGKCAVELRSRWLPAHCPAGFLLRLAVTEAESWVLADPVALADFLGLSAARIPTNPDTLVDAKREVLRLASQAKHRPIRQEMVSSLDRNKPGVGYNLHLCAFAAQHWSPQRAAERSPSLARALRRLHALEA